MTSSDVSSFICCSIDIIVALCSTIKKPEFFSTEYVEGRVGYDLYGDE